MYMEILDLFEERTSMAYTMIIVDRCCHGMMDYRSLVLLRREQPPRLITSVKELREYRNVQYLEPLLA
ncbi:hypothetical protein VNO77_39419 [Canavalia gladiata]|uniref:Uncharacterized protein n=1 Tax=Canavalia gladiata TaxID=3824 RepID=A0AAN9KCK4_CANGL